MIPVVRRKTPEFNLQRASIEWLRLALIPPAFVTSIETGRASRVARMMDASRGILPGFPDSLVIWPGGVMGLEFKTEKGILRDSQTAMAKMLAACRIMVYTCRSVDHVEWACKREAVPIRANVRLQLDPVAAARAGGA